MQSRYYDPELGRFINADAYCSTGQGVVGNNMFAYCGSNPANYGDPSGYRRKFWYALFQDHQPGYIHTKVQLHILATYNAYEAIYRKEYYLPGIGRADIVNPSTGEAWEIKHGGSSVDSELRGISNALSQLEKYTGEKTGLHPGAAGEFAGIFTINYEKNTYMVIYLTPETGVILYYLFPIESSAKADYVYSPATVPSTATLSSSVGLSLLVLPMGLSGGCGGGIEPINKIAYCN